MLKNLLSLFALWLIANFAFAGGETLTKELYDNSVSDVLHIVDEKAENETGYAATITDSTNGNMELRFWDAMSGEQIVLDKEILFKTKNKKPLAMSFANKNNLVVSFDDGEIRQYIFNLETKKLENAYSRISAPLGKQSKLGLKVNKMKSLPELNAVLLDVNNTNVYGLPKGSSIIFDLDPRKEAIMARLKAPAEAGAHGLSSVRHINSVAVPLNINGQKIKATLIDVAISEEHRPQIGFNTGNTQTRRRGRRTDIGFGEDTVLKYPKDVYEIHQTSLLVEVQGKLQIVPFFNSLQLNQMNQNYSGVEGRLYDSAGVNIYEGKVYFYLSYEKERAIDIYTVTLDEISDAISNNKQMPLKRIGQGRNTLAKSKYLSGLEVNDSYDGRYLISQSVDKKSARIVDMHHLLAADSARAYQHIHFGDKQLLNIFTAINGNVYFEFEDGSFEHWGLYSIKNENGSVIGKPKKIKGGTYASEDELPAFIKRTIYGEKDSLEIALNSNIKACESSLLPLKDVNL